MVRLRGAETHLRGTETIANPSRIGCTFLSQGCKAISTNYSLDNTTGQRLRTRLQQSAPQENKTERMGLLYFCLASAINHQPSHACEVILNTLTLRESYPERRATIRHRGVAGSVSWSIMEDKDWWISTGFVERVRQWTSRVKKVNQKCTYII